MSQQGETAADLVNTASREELSRILRDYGEEPYAWQIAGRIVDLRETAPFETTLQLAEAVASAMPPAQRRKNKNPARRTFQALRIAVNHELDALDEGLDTIFEHLAPGGRLCVITFHSLEDRLVKKQVPPLGNSLAPVRRNFRSAYAEAKPRRSWSTISPSRLAGRSWRRTGRSRSARLRVLEKC